MQIQQIWIFLNYFIFDDEVSKLRKLFLEKYYVNLDFFFKFFVYNLDFNTCFCMDLVL